jgi:putative FmdB family regulatory protein
MPIYAYKCASCGYAQDVLQKVSDAPLTQCPQCAAATFAKQLTAAGFQLRGSGWYATDFKNGSGKANNTSTSTESKGSDSGDAAKTEKTAAAASGSCGHGGCSACS